MPGKKSQQVEGRLQFISPQEVADTGLANLRTVQRMCASGAIEAVKVGNLWRIRREEFNRQFGTSI